MNPIRWCRRGDTIATVKPLSEFCGQMASQHLNAKCDTPESCAYANELIAAGRWRVAVCGSCGQQIEKCECDGSG